MQLTFWEGLELPALPEIERLECGAVDDGCEHKCRSIPKHSHYRCPKATLTFWEGLELPAVHQVELLQVTELACTCKTTAQSANITALLRAEARSLQATRFAKAKLTFWEGLELLAVNE